MTRHFKIIKVDDEYIENGKRFSIIDKKAPIDVYLKIIPYVCRTYNKNIAKVAIKETTRGSKKKIFTFEGKKQLVRVFDDYYQYQYHVKVIPFF